jgi:UDP-N-acetylglucosamine acyltransferase
MDSKNGKISEAKRPAWFRYLFNFRFWSDEHPKISPQAVVDPKAEIAEDVEIGPFCVVGPEVKIAAGCRLLNSVTVVGQTTIGRDNIFFPNSVIGTAPQDKKYKGAPTRLEIGNGNAFREACTVHVGTEKGGGVTKIGDNNLLMVNSHVAHDCLIGSHCVISNNTMIAGHVVVGDFVAMMGGVGVHHFVTIGHHAYLGGYCRIHHDVPPFVKVDGSDQIRGLNKVGLSRAKFSPEDIAALENAYRRLFLRKRPFALAMLEFEDLDSLNPQVRYLIEFLRRRDEGKHGRYLEGLRAKESPADYFEVAQVLPSGGTNVPQLPQEPEPAAPAAATAAAEPVAPGT